MCRFLFHSIVYFKFKLISAVFVFVFVCGGAGSYSLSLFKKPVLLPCNHLFCEFVTSLSLLYRIFWLFCCTTFLINENDLNIFGHFMFGSSCLADCVTAGAGSECAACNAKYPQTGN